jgi:hypothetical protein
MATNLQDKGLAANVHPEVTGCYSFEEVRNTVGSGRSRHPEDVNVELDLQVFVTRLNLSGPCQTRFARPLRDFVVHHHANILWYDRNIKSEERRRALYFWTNIGLLIAIPIGVLGLTYYANGLGTDLKPRWDSGLTSSTITAVLAGLFGAQRALTAWLDKRQLAALYNKTRAKLKSAVYTFEQAWRHETVNDVNFVAFGLALEAATDAARATVEDEQDAHYEIEAAPTFSLQDMLTGATSGAQTLTGELAAKETEDQKERREAAQTVRDQDSQILEYKLSIAQKRAALPGANATVQAQLVTDINALSQKQSAAELARGIALAKVSAA